MLSRIALKRGAAVLSIAAALSGCIASAALRNARHAEERQDYDVAVVEYTRALQRDAQCWSANPAAHNHNVLRHGHIVPAQ